MHQRNMLTTPVISNWGKWGRPGKPRDDIQAMLKERGVVKGKSKWLKDLVDDGSEEMNDMCQRASEAHQNRFH